jgi:hypothetical protein
MARGISQRSIEGGRPFAIAPGDCEPLLTWLGIRCHRRIAWLPELSRLIALLASTASSIDLFRVRLRIVDWLRRSAPVPVGIKSISVFQSQSRCHTEIITPVDRPTLEPAVPPRRRTTRNAMRAINQAPVSPAVSVSHQEPPDCFRPPASDSGQPHLPKANQSHSTIVPRVPARHTKR